MLSLRNYFDIGMNLTWGRFLRIFNIAFAPRVIAYTVTWRCNALCDMCGIKNVDSSLKHREKELNAEDVSRIFKDRLLRNLDLIRFTGGEPFLKEDFPDIVETIIKNTKTKIYYITTNGYFSQKIIEFVKRIAPISSNLVIQISLDAIGKTHDEIRRLPSLYDKAIETLNGLKELKVKYNFDFGINQTITPDTISYLYDISDICHRFNCEHKIYFGYHVHESDILEGDNLNARLRLISDPQKDTIRDMFDYIEKYLDRRNNYRKTIFNPNQLWQNVEKYILLGGKNRLLKDYIYPNPPCLAMFLYLRLLPDGTVMPCTLKPKAMGSLKKQTFSEIWKSKETRKMRSEIKKCKGCWVECDIVPNIVYSPIMIKEICRKFFTLQN